ncbi:MAG: methyltransferase domain-containing protein [Acidimicrobiales bacterium]|nr:methyltransferase domain-containing protein [Acidimicrobiales bacterium]MCB9395003.1 methyltransferase domain-containing protein [Acidimicrobiaceae bacterium]
MTSAGEHVSPQWARWRATVDLGEYESRFGHPDAHGEADLLSSLRPRSVLDAGCGTGRVAIELHRRGIEVMGVDLDDDLLALARAKAPDVEWRCVDLATMELGRRFHVVAMPGNVMLFCRAESRAALVARAAAHLDGVDGLVVAGFSVRVGDLSLEEYDRHAVAAGLDLVDRWAAWDRTPYTGGDYAVSVHRPTAAG